MVFPPPPLPSRCCCVTDLDAVTASFLKTLICEASDPSNLEELAIEGLQRQGPLYVVFDVDILPRGKSENFRPDVSGRG